MGGNPGRLSKTLKIRDMKLGNLFTTTKPDFKPFPMNQPTAPNDAFVKNGSIVILHNSSFYLVEWEAVGTRSDCKANVSVSEIHASDSRGNVPRRFNLKWTNDDLLIEAVHAAYAHVGKHHLLGYTLSQTIN